MMTNTLNLSDLISIFSSFIFSLVFTHWARTKFGERSFQDHATSRSLHSGVTPKVGGLGLLPSLCLGLSIHALFGAVLEKGQSFDLGQFHQFFAWIAPAAIVYLVCVLNDRVRTELPAAIRLLSFFVASMLFVALKLYLSPTGTFDLVLADLFPISSLNHSGKIFLFAIFATMSVLAFTNFYNFMDGMDGLAGSMGLIGFATLGVLAIQGPPNSNLGVAPLIVSASCLGFLFWNWPRAKVFMGDTGSTFLGFSACALGWSGCLDDLWHWSIPFLVFFPFWFDASITLLRRLLRGEKIWQAHREHFYQRAVLSLEGLEMSERHLKVLMPSIALMLISSLVAIAQQLNWLGLNRFQPWAAVAMLTLIHGSLAIWVEARFRASVHQDLLTTQKT
jgi:UDP-N-acetylmuramyl pentapeptide phosphotransferase/UDP-N-acetylglucosamine-1-phosphate transferase